MTKADMLNKRRFASISIKNCFAGVKLNDGTLLADKSPNLAQPVLRFASADQIFLLSL
jgi:hypothetical protein